MNPKNATKKTFKGPASTLRIALVVSRFHERITDKLLDGALKCLRDHGVPEKNRKVVFCPGAFELPQVASRLARQNTWDAIICLGVVIRGETPHFEYVSHETARGIQNVALQFALPVVFGVLTTNTERQALARAGGTKGNKGWDAAWTALEMAALFNALNTKSR